jgi:hypothetical protein
MPLKLLPPLQLPSLLLSLKSLESSELFAFTTLP